MTMTSDDTPALAQSFEDAPSVLRAVLGFIDDADTDRVRHLYGDVFGIHSVRSDTMVGNALMQETLRNHVVQTLTIISLLHIVPTEPSREVTTPENIDALIAEIGERSE